MATKFKETCKNAPDLWLVDDDIISEKAIKIRDCYIRNNTIDEVIDYLCSFMKSSGAKAGLILDLNNLKEV